ncbi:MAG: hypothetical protein R3C24_14490 [Cyanobacteriota/Melainabacteria group bacterium]|nr:hypothetical protein [Cyanobacteria bacterium HKST-UBA01]MCB9467708.1 hypothetical protein [Candidatus Obscuribacterales bacterium]
MSVSIRAGIILLLYLCAVLPGSVLPAGAEALSGHVQKKGVHGENGEKNDSDTLDGEDMDPGEARDRPYTPPVSATPPVYRNESGSSAPASYQPTYRPGSEPVSNGVPNLPANSFPSTFLGRWHCVTEVVDSYVRDVGVGTKMVSEVKFSRKPDGRVVADWLQPGWTESQAFAVTWSDKEARVDRTCYYFADGMQGAWASRSRDHFIMQEPAKMVCKSYIDQYIDGRYLGRYRTVSVLTRLIN